MGTDGKVVKTPEVIRPTSELLMHLEVYSHRLDVSASVYTQPIAYVALSLVGISLEVPLISEDVVMPSPVPTTAYPTPSS